MSKQTAVEWLQKEIDNKDMGEIPIWVYEFIEQAKAIEKEQMIDFAQTWQDSPLERYDCKEDLYNETYKGGNEPQNPAFLVGAVICCGVLERMELGWMKLEDGTRCMPYIKGHSDENMYRVNNCPSCGKYVRDVMVEP